ncbi:hypothetical protein DITRI_Ditri20bG0116600 [Diplodiscus trichospermus]
MWKPSSSSRLVDAFLKLRFNRHQVNPFRTPPPPPSSSSANVFRQLPSHPSPSSNAGLSHFQFFSLKTSNSGQKFNGNFTKNVFQNPANAFTSTLSRYRQAIGLHFDAFFRRKYLFLFGAGGVLLCALLWRIMFGIANTFVSLSKEWQSMAFLPFPLQLFVSLIDHCIGDRCHLTSFCFMLILLSSVYIRSRLTINPDKIYRMAMRRLNTAAGVLEVMGAPLSGTDLRAYVMSGAGLTLKNFKPKLRSKRCFLIFPVQGSERKGLVSVEVKKNKGENMDTIVEELMVGGWVVDIPMASGPDQQLFLIGDEKEYKVGGRLISELRDPVVKAMSATKEFDDLDHIEEEEDAKRELQEAERKHREEIEKLEKGGNQ